jgi:hypothetical protein
MAGFSPYTADAAPLSRSPGLPVAAGQGEGAAPAAAAADDDNNAVFPLLDLLERFPDLFAQKVLPHVDPIDRTFLAQTGGAARAAVAASYLPRAGTRVEVQGKGVWRVGHKVREFCTSVERLAWALNNGCPLVEQICASAALGGRLDVLQWARANACPWDEWTCEAAAKGGHLEVLRWAREHLCPWDWITCVCAAGGGHLEVLQWAREHGCPWSKRSCGDISRLQGHHETHAWVLAQPE